MGSPYSHSDRVGRRQRNNLCYSSTHDHKTITNKSRTAKPTLAFSANSQHHIRHTVEQKIDLQLLVTAALRPEGDRAHLIHAHRFGVLEIAHEPCCEPVDVRTIVAVREGAH